MSHEIDRRELLKLSAVGSAAWLASPPANAEHGVGRVHFEIDRPGKCSTWDAAMDAVENSH